MSVLESSISRFCILIVLGTVGGRCRSRMGEGGNVRKGGMAEGFCREVKRGSNRREEGVTVLLRMSNAVSYDPSEAVMEGGGWFCRTCVPAFMCAGRCGRLMEDDRPSWGPIWTCASPSDSMFSGPCAEQRQGGALSG